MLASGPSVLLQYARTYGNRFFLQFGLHCATHQIRIILVSGVVITSLFYPALALYSSSGPEFLSVLDVTRSQYPQDLVNVWAGYDSLRVLEDAVSLAKTRASCEGNSTLRVERILIQSPFDGAVNHQILQSTLELERRIDDLEVPCLKRADGTCFVLSPLAFWRHDEDTLRSDPSILDTLLSRNISVAGVPITPQMVLAGRGSDSPHVVGTNFDYATFLALTYFFPNSDCLGSAEHVAWLKAVDEASQNAPRTAQMQEPTLIALEYDESRSRSRGWTAISALICLAYSAFVVYVLWLVRSMDAVHSRIGITFTALVEIAVSTITSVSVCALVGFKVTMVPWELLPIVIVFVGAENMFNLVDAVGKTSVTLSVKQRIAQGLSHAGTSNTLKVVSYNAILGVIAVFAAGAIRQFCVFAVVVLVAHWFLAHTFFVAVLSIDMQRLELDELIRQNPSLGLAVPPPITREVMSKKSRSPWEKLVLMVLHGRATKNISLLMLLAITGTLYYTTYPTEPHLPMEEVQRALTRTNYTSTLPHQPSPAWNVWKTLNPSEKTLHLRIEAPVVLTLRSDSHSTDTPTSHRPQILSMRVLSWMLKIVVLPITATITVLYGLLLYLLKDTELLEAQRNRPDIDSPEVVEEEDAGAFEGRISFSTLPRAFASDVALIATSQDGGLVVSVGMQNEVTIWRMPSRVHVLIDVTDVLLGSASTSSAPSTLTCVAVDAGGGYCAVGTGAGNIAVWSIGKHSVHPLPLLSLTNSSAAVVDLQFPSAPGRGARRSPPQSEPSSPEDQQAPVSLVATYESGLAAKWGIGISAGATFFAPSQRAALVRTLLLRVPQADNVLVGFCMDDGTLEFAEVQGTQALVLPEHSICAGNPADVVASAHVCLVEVSGSTRLVIAAATESGTVSLWDGGTGELIHLLDESHGRINRLRISPAPAGPCSSCGKLPLDGFFLAFSVDNIVHFFRIYLTDQARRCSCNVHQPRRVPSWDSLGRHSRATSIAASPGGSPSIPRTKLPSVFEPPPFPISGHGVRSRRVSEKDTWTRRSLETLTIPALGEDGELLGPLDSLMMRPSPSVTASVWQHVFVVRVADTVCDRGGWDVSDRRVVGVRRKPRSAVKSERVNVNPLAELPGLTPATLERWELWSFDPSGARVQSSALASLVGNVEILPRASTSSTSSASTDSSRSSRKDTIPRLPFTRVSPFLISRSHSLAGFGNTVGVFNLISQ
ncbi:sterol regulatory element binding protein cleavage-activating protein [Mycena metata]|uniref:Sterol regulatory element-binding protein cleavage-activating protein n=1 Tax=Mycena metata TaxID=1033252 RepID=A0AAD7JTG6_9AGAR|nr:sterol regulatory element binding protein cleavage-activating protein [Mycena metata]